MAVLGQAGVRKTPDDRNPATGNVNTQFNSDGVAPAGLTVRATYTVPTNKKASVQSFLCQLVRATAAAPALRADASILHVPTVGNNVLIARARSMTNAVGDRAEQVGSPQTYLNVGDTVRLQTQDTSTGGTVDYALAISGIEFDA